MKLYILILILGFLSACSPPPSGTSPKTQGEEMILVPGTSRDVQIEYFGVSRDKHLPDGMIVNIETPDVTFASLNVASFPNVPQKYVDSSQHVSFGCDNSSDNVLPARIVADTITFCGDLEYHKSGLSYQANLIIFNSARIKIINSGLEPSLFTITIRAKEVQATGPSTITLEGATTELRRSLPPELILGAMMFSLYESLEITSKAEYEYIKRSL